MGFDVWATGISAGLPAPVGNSVLNFLVATDRPELFSVGPVRIHFVSRGVAYTADSD